MPMDPETDIPLTRERLARMKVEQPIIADRLTWLTVHGACCLALRHPQFTGSSRKVLEEFVAQLGQGFVEWGVLSQDELASVARTEAEESPHGQ